MNVEAIIPWRGGCPWREQAFAWVLERHLERWPTTAAVCPAERWVKAAAAMPAVQHSSASVVVVADADVWCDGLDAAVAAVLDGEAWAIPHGKVHRLTRDATQLVLEGQAPATLTGHVHEQIPYTGIAGGGLVVLRREVALDVPLDPRFEGWGGEDHSWGYALQTLAGRPWRGDAPLWHLWHPAAPRLSRKIGSEPSEALRRRYWAAMSNPQAMRNLIEEIPWPSSVSR